MVREGERSGARRFGEELRQRDHAGGCGGRRADERRSGHHDARMGRSRLPGRRSRRAPPGGPSSLRRAGAGECRPGAQLSRPRQRRPRPPDGAVHSARRPIRPVAWRRRRTDGGKLSRKGRHGRRERDPHPRSERAPGPIDVRGCLRPLTQPGSVDDADQLPGAGAAEGWCAAVCVLFLPAPVHVRTAAACRPAADDRPRGVQGQDRLHRLHRVRSRGRVQQPVRR